MIPIDPAAEALMRLARPDVRIVFFKALEDDEDLARRV